MEKLLCSEIPKSKLFLGSKQYSIYSKFCIYYKYYSIYSKYCVPFKKSLLNPIWQQPLYTKIYFDLTLLINMLLSIKHIMICEIAFM